MKNNGLFIIIFNLSLILMLIKIITLQCVIFTLHIKLNYLTYIKHQVSGQASYTHCPQSYPQAFVKNLYTHG